jgi:hypothetical protein
MKKKNFLLEVKTKSVSLPLQKEVLFITLQNQPRTRLDKGI